MNEWMIMQNEWRCTPCSYLPDQDVLWQCEHTSGWSQYLKMKKLGMFFLNPDKATQKRILARMNNQLCKEDDFTGHMLNDQVSLTLRCYLQKKKSF